MFPINRIAACIDSLTLVDLTNGNLADTKLEILTSHLSQCANCRERYEELLKQDAVSLMEMVCKVTEPDGLDEENLNKILERMKTANEWETTQKKDIGRFKVIRKIGQGGMGEIYECYDTRLMRVVAVKKIRSDCFSPKMLERLRLEASIQARLNHSHIVQVYEIGLLDSSPFIAMEFIKGRSLRELLENQPMEAAAAARLVAKLAVAIHHAHVAGVLHCDLKPSNILIEQRNEDKDSEFEPKIADFGLAKLMDETGVVSESSVLAGTPAYLSPEQAGNDRCAVGSASDIYTLGVILYECLTGHPPFNANNTGLLLEMIKGLEPVSPRKLVPGISRNLETICLKCLSKDPARRYLSAQALADDLCHFLEGRPILARPAGSLETVSRWCMRNRRLAASLTTIFLMTIFFLAYAFWSAADQRNLRLLAEAETRRANESELAAMSQRNMAYSYLLEKLHKFKAIMTMLDNPQIKLANVKGVTEIQMQINDSIREETRQILKDPQLLETKPEIVFQMLYLQSMISRMVNDQSGFKQSTTRLIGLFFELKDPSTELAIDYLNASHLLANNLIGEHDTAGAMNIWERVWQSYATGKLNEYLNRQETQRSLQINLSGYQYFLAKCGQMKKAGAVGNGLASLKQFQTPLK